MQKHQLRDVVDDPALEPQSPQPFTGHTRPNNLVVMESDAAGPELAGGRFADVVQ
jgi:hypothetical protein